MSTENPSRPEDEAPGRSTMNESVGGGAPADEAPSLEIPALAPVVGANGEILTVREDPAQLDAAAPGGPGPLGPGVGAAIPRAGTPGSPGTPGTPATPQAGVGFSTSPPGTPGTPATPQTGAPVPRGAVSPAQAAPGSGPGQVAPAAGAFPFGRPDDDPLTLEKPDPVVLAPDAGEPDGAGKPPVEDTAVRRRSLFTPAQPVPTETPGTADPTPGETAPGEAAGAFPDAAPGAGEPAGYAASPSAGPEPNPVPTPAVGPEQLATRRTRLRSGLVDGGDDDVLLDGSTVIGHPKSRAATHWAGVLVSIVALPVTWFFLHDGAAMATSRASDSFDFNVSARGLTELAVGALALIIAMWVARRTSVGSIVVGVISILLGLPFLVAPGVMTDAFSPFLSTLSTQSALGQSMSTYLWTDAVTGKFLVLGLFMVMVGVVSYTARLDGQREQESIDRARRRAGGAG